MEENGEVILSLLKTRDGVRGQRQQEALALKAKREEEARASEAKRVAEIQQTQASIDEAVSKLFRDNYAAFITNSVDIGVTANGKSLFVRIAEVHGDQLCRPQMAILDSDPAFEETGFEIKGLGAFADDFVSLPARQCLSGPEVHSARDTYRFTNDKRLYLGRFDDDNGRWIRLYMRVDRPEGKRVVSRCSLCCGRARKKSELHLYRV